MFTHPALRSNGSAFIASFVSLIVLAGVFPIAVPANAADWPQWRGPNRDGVSAETGWSVTWPAEGPKVLWKASVGAGCSSFAIVGNLAYTMGNQKDTDSVYCLDSTTGKVIWQYDYSSPLNAQNFEGGPCTTPTVEGGLVYTLSRQGQLFCLNAGTGKVVWSKDFQKDFGARAPKWGYTGSPLVSGKMLILDVGGKGASAVAFDKATGNVIWQAGDDAESYSSPIAFRSGARECVAHFNAAGLVIRDIKDGKELSRFPWKTSYDVNPTTPIISGDKIFISSGYGHGAALLQFADGSIKPLWQSPSMKNKTNSSVLWKDNVYGFDESASLTCLDLATGTPKWKMNGLGTGSLMASDGKLIIMSEKGKLVVAEASPEAYKELAGAPVLNERSWVVPVLANGRIYCRDNKGNVVCLDVSAR